MNTDELIGLLGTSFADEPTRSRQLTRMLGFTTAFGAASALSLSVLALGLRTDLVEEKAFTFLLLKLAFAVTIGIVALRFLGHLIRPGGEHRVRLEMAAVPFAIIMLLAALSLVSAPASHWRGMITGEMWLECVVSIPIIAVVPFAALMGVVRWIGAPTDLARTGAMVGLVAGAVSAMGYALHCVNDTIPFVALWYGGTIALCSLAGTLLGPRMLRW